MMEPRTKHFVTYASVAIVFLAVGIFAGKLMWGSSATYTPEPKAQFTIATTSDSDTSSETPSSEQTAPQPPEDPLASCEDSLAQQASQNGAFEKGTILVSFNDDTTYEGAVEILDSYDLKPHNGADQEASFDANHFLTADVPSGDEYKEICTLRGKSNIKYAAINYTFNLAQ